MESGLKFLKNIYLAEKLKGLIEQLKERAIARGLGTVAARGQIRTSVFNASRVCACPARGKEISRVCACAARSSVAVSIKIGKSQHLSESRVSKWDKMM